MVEIVSGQAALASFESLSEYYHRQDDVVVDSPFPYSLQLSPKGQEEQVPRLAVSGATHGNELQGLLAINSILESLKSRVDQIVQPILVFVGNPLAVERGARDGQRNMNRSFGKRDIDTYETHRAKSIEHAIRGVPYVLDIHAVNAPTRRPFGMAPDRADMHHFIGSLGTDIRDIVLMDVLSPEEGLCLDEYAYLHGTSKAPVVGVTLEVGHVSDFDLAVQRATQAIRGAMNYAEVCVGDKAPFQELSLWEEYHVYPQDGDNWIVPGLENLQDVQAGMAIGGRNSTGETLYVLQDGVLLFPKYVDRSAPALIRLARRHQ